MGPLMEGAEGEPKRPKESRQWQRNESKAIGRAEKRLVQGRISVGKWALAGHDETSIFGHP